MKSANVDAGDLIHRVTITGPAEVPDAYGQLVQAPTTLAVVWALIRTPTGREAITAQQLQAQLTHVIEMRYPGAVTFSPACQITYKGRTFNVISVPNVDERNRRLDVHCTEVVAVPAPTYPPAGGG